MGKLKVAFFVLLQLLTSNLGCGDEEEQPTAPAYQQSGATSEMEGALKTKTLGLLNMSYDDWMKRFSPSTETSALATDALSRYKGLMDTQDYSLKDYTATEQNYLDTVLRKYGEARGEAFKPLQESLISENLFGSGPGYDIMGKFGKETATGVGDISKQWAYEGIQRKQQQTAYYDALKRGDYSTMYNLALSEQQREQEPVRAATGAEFSAISPAMSLYGGLSQEDIARYNAAMQGYGYNLSAQQPTSNYGGLGMGLGMLAGGLLAAPTGGMSIPMGALIGGGVGGGVGSLWQY